MEVTEKIIDQLVEIANNDPIVNRHGMNNPMAETVSQEWASRKLGRMSTVASVRALAKISNWDVRHAGFECIESWEARSILIEMLSNDDLAYSAATAAKSVGYSDKMRDALIACCNRAMKEHDGIGKPTKFTRAIQSLAKISSGDNTSKTIEFLLQWHSLFYNDKYLFDPIKEAVDGYLGDNE